MTSALPLNRGSHRVNPKLANSINTISDSECRSVLEYRKRDPFGVALKLDFRHIFDSFENSLITPLRLRPRREPVA